MILKKQLVGLNFKNLLIAKGLKKYRIAKGCGITYRTLLNWQKDITTPSDDNAILVGRYLGLIKPEEAEKRQLEKEVDELKAKIKRLGNA